MFNFNENDFVIGTSNGYGITCKDSLSVVVKAPDTDGEMVVIWLYTPYKYNTNAKKLEIEKIKSLISEGSYDWHETDKLGGFSVSANRFEFTTLSEFEETHCLSNFQKNPNFDDVINISFKGGKEMNVVVEKYDEPVINPEKESYDFSSRKKDILSEMKDLLTEYDHPSASKGLNTIWDTFSRNKAGVAGILSKHPNWNPEMMAIVFNQDYKRVTDPDAIREFCEWCATQLYNVWAKSHSYMRFNMTVDELETAYYDVKWLYDNACETANGRRGNKNHTIKVNGMSLEELKEERNFWYNLYAEANKDSMYLYNGVYLSKENYKKYYNAKTFLDYIRTYDYDNLATVEFADKANELAKPFDTVDRRGKVKGFGAVEGQKISKIVRKFFKLYEFDKIVEMSKVYWTTTNALGETIQHERDADIGWNKQYTLYADAVNPYTITRHTILSVNPIDYLTMSFGNSWGSCHTIDKKNKRGVSNNYSGCYCSGTLSYMLDSSSFILYTVDSAYEGDKFYTQPKIQRCVFCLGKDKFLQSRVYPDGRSAGKETGIAVQFRNIVSKVLADIAKVDNLWTVKKGIAECDNITYSNGTHYKDYVEYNDGAVMYLKRTGVKRNEDLIYIGHDPICPVCGDEHYTEEYLACEDCMSERRCDWCDNAIIDEDDRIECEDSDNVYCCAECAERAGAHYCENGNGWYRWDVEIDTYTDEYIWMHDDEALTLYSRNRGYCYYANEYNAENDGWHYINDEWLHEDDDKIVQCYGCDEWLLKRDATEIDGKFYCDECAEDMIEEVEEDDATDGSSSVA